MVLDYATSQFLEKVSGSASKARHLMTPQEAREAFTKLRGILSTGSEIEEVKDLIIPVPDGEASQHGGQAHPGCGHHLPRI